MPLIKTRFEQIPGWFRAIDCSLFHWILSKQTEEHETGDIAELGVYQGKSAILMGLHLQASEEFVVIDLFDQIPEDGPNRVENSAHYPQLTQAMFEENYRKFHPQLPRIVQGQSREIVDHARHGTYRFVHIDASHLYGHVREDIAASRRLLGSQGIVVFDDFREPHTPGVAAAVWEAVANDNLHVLLMTEYKLYATWSDPTIWHGRLERWLRQSTLLWEELEIHGLPVFRAWTAPSRSLLRRLAEAALPPAIVYRLSRARARFAGAR